MALDKSRTGLLSERNGAVAGKQPSYRDDVELEARASPASSRASSDLDATEFLQHDRLVNQTQANAKPAFLKPPRKPAKWYSLRGRSRCCLICLGLVLATWVLFGAGGVYAYKKWRKEPAYGQSPPWYPAPPGGTAHKWATSYSKASAIVSRMTLAEKVNITTGTGWMMGPAVGNTGPAMYSGFPTLYLQDGPLGVRFADQVTAFPAGITVGASWNKTLMYLRGRAIGAEARGKGINVLLGPSVGPLGRHPAGGRNWEGFGADPYLQGVAAAQTIKGIQGEGVMATVKHFVANEQEHFRQAGLLQHAISANVDDRTMHELYAWPFGDAVKAGVASVMCSYNQINSSYACQNSKLINGILKDELGFQGFVQSDWLAQRSGVASALAGLDLSMPGDGLGWADGDSLWGAQLSRSVLNGTVPIGRLNDMVTRIVAAWFQLGQDNTILFPREPPNFSSWTHEPNGVAFPGSPSTQGKTVVNKFVKVQADHDHIACAVAIEGIVLLKNELVLPLDRNGNLDMKTRTRHHGKPKIGVFGEDAAPSKWGPNACPDRACNDGTLASGWGSGSVDFPYLVAPIEALRRELNRTQVELHEFLTNDAPANDSVMQDLDLCIVFANSDAGEGFASWSDVKGDRNNLELQKGGDDLIVTVASRCGLGIGRVVVVLHTVGPVVMEKWIDMPNVNAVLLANLAGQESGNALVHVLFGDVNPSGHLPYTIGKSLDDYGPEAKILYSTIAPAPQQNFSEGLYIDYRHFDKKLIAPRFAFGFGLSYTDFELSNMQVSPVKSKSAAPSPRPEAPAHRPPSYPIDIPPDQEALAPEGFVPLKKYIYPYLSTVDDLVGKPYPFPAGYEIVQPPSNAGGEEGGNPDLWETYVRVRVDVSNIGARPGGAVAQLYMAYPQVRNDVDFPVKVLRGFNKIFLDKGEIRSVEFNLTRRDLSYWDVRAQDWRIVMEGKYTFMVGQSSIDLTAFGEW